MNRRMAQLSIPILRWTVGLVVLVESVRFVLSTGVAHFLAEAGLPVWIRPALGGAEILAAGLFLIPFTERIGSYALLVVFAFATLIHFVHGQFEVGGLVVYAAAVFVCLAYRNNETAEARHG
jgi:hypothetical protein